MNHIKGREYIMKKKEDNVISLADIDPDKLYSHLGHKGVEKYNHAWSVKIHNSDEEFILIDGIIKEYDNV